MQIQSAKLAYEVDSDKTEARAKLYSVIAQILDELIGDVEGIWGRVEKQTFVVRMDGLEDMWEQWESVLRVKARCEEGLRRDPAGSKKKAEDADKTV